MSDWRPWEPSREAVAAAERERYDVYKCTCYPPRKLSSWWGDVGYVVQRDPYCELHFAPLPDLE